MPPLKIPRTIGRYEIIDRIGHGGMGVVYRARDPRIGRSVAVKLLRVTDEEVRERFLQEARSAGNLKHHNIVTVYDFGEHEDQPYIVMEFVEGTTLAQTIRDRTPLPLTRKIELMEALADGLAYAHIRGVIHRDVKPANIMIDADGVLRILDFGVARVADSEMTQAGTIMGTPNYMSPEQVNGLPVDRRSDIFAVGLVLYELLSYRQAFSGNTAHHVMHAIALSTPAPLLQVCPDLDPALSSVVDRAIEKDMGRRYQTLTEMSAHLARIRRRLPSEPDPSTGDSTIILPSAARTPPVRPTPRGTDRQDLSRRRGALIDGYLVAAQEAFDRSDFAAAIDRCEQAAIIDPDDARVLALLDRTLTAQQEQQVRTWLADARASLNRGDVPSAQALASRAEHAEPDSADVRQLRHQIDGAERQIREQQDRARRIEVGLARARQALDEGRPEEAVRATSEVLVDDPQQPEARDLNGLATAAIAQRDAERAHGRAAQDAVAAAERGFANGRHDESLGALRSFGPPHPLVTTAIESLSRQLADLRRREEEDRERRAAEAAEQARLNRERIARVSGGLSAARSLLDSDRFEEALALVRSIEPPTELASERDRLLQRAEQGAAAAKEAARRRAESLQQIQVAEEALRTRHTEAAAAALADATRLDHSAPGLAALRARIDAAAEQMRIDRAAEAEERRRTDERHEMLERARRLVQTSAYADALRVLEDVVAAHGQTADVQELRSKAQTGVEEARRRAEHDQRATEAIDRALELFGDGRHDAAFAELTAVAPEHPRVAQTIRELRAEAAAKEQRAAEAAAARLRQAAESILFEAQNLLRAGKSREAAAAHDRASSMDASIRGAAELRREIDAALRAEEEERVREHGVREVLARARQMESTGDADGALRTLEGAPAHALLAAETARLRAAIREERERRQEAARREAKERARLEDARDAAARSLPTPQASGATELVIREPAPEFAPQQEAFVPSERRESSRAGVWLAAAAIVLVAGAGALWIWRDRPPESALVQPQGGTPSPTVPASSGTPAPPQQPERATTAPQVGSQSPPQTTSAGSGSGRRETAAPVAGRTGNPSPPVPAPRVPAPNRAGATLPPPTTGRTGVEKPPAISTPAAAGAGTGAVPAAPIAPATTIPGTPEVTPVSPPPPPSSPPPAAAPPNPSAAPAPPSIDEPSASRILRDFFARYGAFDLAGLSQLYPKAATSERKRIDALRRDFRGCTYSVRVTQLTATSPATASVRAYVAETCTPKVRTDKQTLEGEHLFELSRGANGAWIVVGHFSS